MISEMNTDIEETQDRIKIKIMPVLSINAL